MNNQVINQMSQIIRQIQSDEQQNAQHLRQLSQQLHQLEDREHQASQQLNQVISMLNQIGSTSNAQGFGQQQYSGSGFGSSMGSTNFPLSNQSNVSGNTPQSFGYSNPNASYSNINRNS